MAKNSVLSYPIPPYQNVNIQAQFYIPNQFFISAITIGQTTTITTSINHNFVIGQLVRLIIPFSFGSRALSNQSGYVISIPSLNQVQLNINSIGVDPFIASTANTKAQIMAIGEINSGQININGIVNQSIFIPGSFQNISPL